MSGTAKPIPDGYQGAIPYLYVQGASEAIEFYKSALGATEFLRLSDPAGLVMHAELKIGETLFMLADEFPGMGVLSPATLGGSPVTIFMYVEDVDAFSGRAVEAGMKVVRPVEDQFYGDRAGKFEDPFGHGWWFATHIEDVSPEEMKKRAAELFGGG